jgi:hypothetical protein
MMKKLDAWVASPDAEVVACEANGYDRGDGVDARIYRSVATGRYIVIVAQQASPRWYVSVYVACSSDDAEAVIRAGYTPGNAPGRYRYIRQPDRLIEVRRCPSR